MITRWLSILRSVNFSSNWSSVKHWQKLFRRATLTRSSVWASDVAEWCSFIWHWDIRYSDKLSRVTIKCSGSSVLDMFTINISATSETMLLSTNWINSGYANIRNFLSKLHPWPAAAEINRTQNTKLSGNHAPMFHYCLVFIALHLCKRGLSTSGLSVHLSVCRSNSWIVTKRKHV